MSPPDKLNPTSNLYNTLNDELLGIKDVNNLMPIPSLPKFPSGSPEVVRILDRIRYELDKNDPNCQYAEFTWFAREYPRVYRHHIEHAEHRLRLIHEGYADAHYWFEKQTRISNDNAFSFSRSDVRITQIHWDFEAYLNCLGSALDVLSRIIGTGHLNHLPMTFTRVCASKAEGDLVTALRDAKIKWVDRLKDYRDCFVHYTPCDTLLMVSCHLYKDGWETRMKLPVNPNARDILLFRYSRRCHILKYAVTVYNHFIALDRKVAKIIGQLYNNGEYPIRTNNLFFTGQRSR